MSFVNKGRYNIEKLNNSSLLSRKLEMGIFRQKPEANTFNGSYLIGERL